jgi:hypothetical protein
VCPRNVITKIVGPPRKDEADSCISGCTYFESFPGDLSDAESLACETENEIEDSLYGKHQFCDCPCDWMVDVQAPSMGMATLSYMAQSLVTTIIGFNMAFRYTNLPKSCLLVSCIIL